MVKRPTTQNSAKQQSLNRTLLTHEKRGGGGGGGEGGKGEDRC